MTAARERIATRLRLAGNSLEAAAMERLIVYYELLSVWNQKVNLTSLPLVEGSNQAIDRLLVEPLTVAALLPDAAIAWCDLGSGGGSPALPIKVLKPRARLTMVESRSKKVAFLREAVRRLGMTGVQVIHDRFEHLALTEAMREAFDVITVRAVRADAVLFVASERLLRPGGELMLLGAAAAAEVPTAFRETGRTPLVSSDGSALIVYERR